MSLETRLQVHLATQQLIANFMAQYNISADVMEDALNRVIITLKDQIMLDLLSAAAQQEPEEENADGESDNGDTEA